MKHLNAIRGHVSVKKYYVPGYCIYCPVILKDGRFCNKMLQYHPINPEYQYYCDMHPKISYLRDGTTVEK